MKSLGRFLIAFLAVTGAVALATALLGVKFRHDDFWNYHGALFLVAIALFPRLTLILSSVAFGGLYWWLGWLFVPRYLVAILATLTYWFQNPILVVLAWLIALGGEGSEKYVMIKRSRGKGRNQRGFDSAKWVKSEKG